MSAATVARSRADLDAQLERGLAGLGLALDRQARIKLLDYLALIEKWNRVFNLTAIRDGEKMISVHLLDCLAVTPHIGGTRILDVGSGAGLPGIPLAVVKPELQVTLLDSNHKKAAFLKQAIAELQLKNASVACERVETWRPAEKFDCIISRALGELAEFVALAKHLLAPAGVFAAMKGVHPFEEIERLPPGFRVKQVLPLSVPGLDAERCLVLIERA
ncbi:MAG: 16S rRNA (guanine(527)-N(7))-methyltransferase RsmG [Burkholderiales bacterium]